MTELPGEMSQSCEKNLTLTEFEKGRFDPPLKNFIHKWPFIQKS